MMSDTSSSGSPIRRGILKKRAIYSSEESLSPAPLKRRNRNQNVISTSSECSESAGPSKRSVQARLKRKVISSDDKEASSGAEDESKVSEVKYDSDDCKDPCAICHRNLKDNEILSRPNVCSHLYHKECLLSWSYKSNTCPLDRFKFQQIVVVKKRAEVESVGVNTPPRQQQSSDTDGRVDIVYGSFSFIDDDNESESESEDVFNSNRLVAVGLLCRICGNDDREEDMIICDRCDSGFHRDCFEPTLMADDDGWICPMCQDILDGDEYFPDESLIDDDEVDDLLNDAMNITGGTILNNRRRRNVSNRTEIRRRNPVRTVTRLRNMQITNINQPSTSGSVTNTRRRRRRTNTTSRRRPTERYNLEVITIEGTPVTVKVATNTGTRQLRNRRRRRRRRRRRQTRVASSSAAGVNNQPKFEEYFPKLDLFGSKPQLEYFSGCEAGDELDHEEYIGMVSSTSGNTSNMRRTTTRTASTINRRKSKINVCNTPVDLLSRILDQQEKWHNPNATFRSNNYGEVTVVLHGQVTSSGPMPSKNVADMSRNNNTNGGNHPTGAGGVSRPSTSSSTNDHTNYSSTRSPRPVPQPVSAPPPPLPSLTGSTSLQDVPPLQPPPQPPAKLCADDDDFDLYADIEPSSSTSSLGVSSELPLPNPPPPASFLPFQILPRGRLPNIRRGNFGTTTTTTTTTLSTRLAPPPEPPAMLFTLDGGDGSSGDEDERLVIDDERQCYDPETPTTPPQSPPPAEIPPLPPGPAPLSVIQPRGKIQLNKNKSEKYKEETAYPPVNQLDLNDIALPTAPQNRRSNLHNVDDEEEDDDDDDECPNRSLYSQASMDIAKQTNVDSDSEKEDSYNIEKKKESTLKEKRADMAEGNKERISSKNSKESKSALVSYTSETDESELESNVEVKEADSEKEAESVAKSSNDNKNEKGDDNVKSEDEEDISDDKKEEIDDKENAQSEGKDSIEAKEDKQDEEPEVKKEEVEEDEIKHSSEFKDDTMAEKESSDVEENSVKKEKKMFDPSTEDKAKLEELSAEEDGKKQLEDCDKNLKKSKSVSEDESDNDEDNKVSSTTENTDHYSDKAHSEDELYESKLDKQRSTDNAESNGKDNSSNAEGLFDHENDVNSISKRRSSSSPQTRNSTPSCEGRRSQSPLARNPSPLEVKHSSPTAEDMFSENASNRGVESKSRDDLENCRKERTRKENDQEDVLELRCEYEDDRDGLVDITDEEISTYERNWEIEDSDNRPSEVSERRVGIEGLDTEAISDWEYTPDDEKDRVTQSLKDMERQNEETARQENGSKEEGEIVADDTTLLQKPQKEESVVTWKKLSKSTKDRSYREKEDSKNRDGKTKKNKKEKTKEKRKELERYDVRKLISEKPKKRRVDEFGRDISSSPSRSSRRSRSRGLSLPRDKRRRSVDRRRRSSRSRSPVRSKRREKSRERVEKGRGRSRSRGRSSRNKSRDRNRSRERNRSRDRGRSSRDKETQRQRQNSRSSQGRLSKNKKRPKSKDRKKRRSPSLSCSTCSCSSCERDRRQTKKKLTVVVPNNNKNTTKKRKKKNKYKDKEFVDPNTKRRRLDSPVPSKEVFTSGDNILVSVNFKSPKSGDMPGGGGRSKESSKKKRNDDESGKKKRDKSTKENQQPLRTVVSGAPRSQSQKKINSRNLKPVAIIDLDASPFREQTPSPKEIIILTDESDSEEKLNQADSCQQSEKPISQNTSTGPKTPPEPHIKFNIISKPQIRSMTNPLIEEEEEEEEEDRGVGSERDVEDPLMTDAIMMMMSSKGPNTPPEPPVPYDPFEPTKSRSPTPKRDTDNIPLVEREMMLMMAGRMNSPEPQPSVMKSPKGIGAGIGVAGGASNTRLHESPRTPSPLQSPPKQPLEGTKDMGLVDKVTSNRLSPPPPLNDYDSDGGGGGGGDSPYSPGSSEGDDLFEPPVPPQIATPTPIAKVKPRAVQQKHPPLKVAAPPVKRKQNNNTNKVSPLKSKSAFNKNSVQLKLDEDQLKILDELPNSAVEMQVKDKFLKKLNRQERVVEEVKLVLKPHYAKKHISKEDYKDILRKSVPKICHSRSGEINPMKIQRLIDAYVQKYRHKRKKKTVTPASTSQIMKPKP